MEPAFLVAEEFVEEHIQQGRETGDGQSAAVEPLGDAGFRRGGEGTSAGGTVGAGGS